MNQDIFTETFTWFNSLSIGLLALLALAAIVLNFLPTYIAYFRNHPNMNLIALLNLVFGWTGIVWLLLLLWALSGRKIALLARE